MSRGGKGWGINIRGVVEIADIERLIKRWRKSLQKEHFQTEIKKRAHYVRPGQKVRDKHFRAVKRLKKNELKRRWTT